MQAARSPSRHHDTQERNDKDPHCWQDTADPGDKQQAEARLGFRLRVLCTALPVTGVHSACGMNEQVGRERGSPGKQQKGRRQQQEVAPPPRPFSLTKTLTFYLPRPLPWAGRGPGGNGGTWSAPSQRRGRLHSDGTPCTAGSGDAKHIPPRGREPGHRELEELLSLPWASGEERGEQHRRAGHSPVPAFSLSLSFSFINVMLPESG